MLVLFEMRVLYGLTRICSSSTIKAQWGSLRCQEKFAMLTKAVYQMWASEKVVPVSLHYTLVQAESKQCETCHQKKDFPKGFISTSFAFVLTEKEQISLLKYSVLGQDSISNMCVCFYTLLHSWVLLCVFLERNCIKMLWGISIVLLMFRFVSKVWWLSTRMVVLLQARH